MKNKTLATWLAFLGGPLGLHRFYLYGRRDGLAWLHPALSAVGLYGIARGFQWGVDDGLMTVLAPLFGVQLVLCGLQSLRYGLMPSAQWNQRFNPQAPDEAEAGQTTGLTVLALITALLIGSTALMATMAFGIQKFFESQIEQPLR